MTATRPLGVGGTFAQKPLDQDLREFARGDDRSLRDARLAMDAEAERHFARGNDEQRLARAGKRAAAIGDPERECPGVGEPRQPLDLVDVEPGLGRRARDLEYGDVARDAPSKARRLRPVRWRRRP